MNTKNIFLCGFLVIIFVLAFTACDESLENNDDGDTYDGTEGLSFILSNNEYHVSAYTGTSNVVNIPSSYKGKPVTAIDNGAFYYHAFYREKVTSVTIPTSITLIGEDAFRGCNNLTTVTFANGSQLKTIDERAFQDCTSLTGIIIPAGVTSIGKAAFYYCRNLTDIIIPASVTTVREGVFNFWTASQIIYVPWTEGNRPSGWISNWRGINCEAQIIYLDQ